jgi:preprotein translocase SecE subunit
MSSETPQQRPPRRDDPAESGSGAPSARPRGRQSDAAAGSPALAGQAGHAPRPPRLSVIMGTKRFIEESIGELKKVDWPAQPQVIQGTGVVLFACLVVGVFLYISDQAFKHLVENVFLGQ